MIMTTITTGSTFKVINLLKYKVIRIFNNIIMSCNLFQNESKSKSKKYHKYVSNEMSTV